MYKFKFIDLFAGIGGFHLAMHNLGGECVFASEIDKYARETYIHNYKSISPELFAANMFNDDIRKITPVNIPDFDVLCAGFPCQPFSQAGQKRGFDDNHNSERGNLFFNIVDIIKAKRPKAFFLENVRGLVAHDNGNTIRVIRDILENELGYSFYLKIVNASDYGLPQLRPRAFMIGFRDEGFMRSFNFPLHTKLKFTMSDVWGGQCSRDIGFTIRVGGRGSNINDRRNWDSYLVDGVVRKLGSAQAQMMQGFPEWFEFPVSEGQAMKQLGNSVAVDAIQTVANSMLHHMNAIDENNDNNTEIMNTTKNKGEWSEIYAFFKLLFERKVYLSDSELNETDNWFIVNNLTTLNIDKSVFIDNNNCAHVVVKDSKDVVNSILVSDILSTDILNEIKDIIRDGSSTFEIKELDKIQNKLGLSIIKGGTSTQKADIVFDIKNDELEKFQEGFSIKSYLGSKPTLFNASGTTNFIYRICGDFDKSAIDDINAINTRTKIKDRINAITQYGGVLNFVKAENEDLNYNLNLVDSEMPTIAGAMLLHYYRDRISSITQAVDSMTKEGFDKNTLQVKIKRLLTDILLGFFPGKKWDGEYSANGTVVVKQDGECVAFHIIELSNLRDYLFNHIKFDTPSSTRHRFGKVYLEKDGCAYFKLNMQLRF